MKGGDYMVQVDNNFSFNLPVDIIKSGDSDSEWRIGGYASTSTEDRQGDEIIQKGLDFSDFVNYGWFNYDHDNSKILGYPDKRKCKVDKNGFYVEGILLKGKELVREIWETALALKKTGDNRKLGFSVEGKVEKRDNSGKIVKAKIYNVAITANPVNCTCTWDALVKSFTESNLNKALEAGYGDSSGSNLIPESLESAFKTLALVIGDDEESKEQMGKLKKRLENRQDISKSELILYFQLTKGLSFDDAESLVNKLNYGG